MTALQHIALIPDGNRTWATQQWLAAYKGHQEWYARTKELLEYVFETIETVVGITFWAMSTENMKKRSAEEKTLLFSLLEQWLAELQPLLEKHNLGFMRHGDREGISQSLLEKLDTLQSTFVATGKKVVNLLFNYGGKWHIQDAMNRCVASWSTQIEPYMTFWELPPVDLVVRTKWAIRTSGFLPWEDYAERYFTDLMYPDFTTDQLDSAIQEWHTRKRNYWA